MTKDYQNKNGYTVSITDDQIKKHVCQMSNEEIMYLSKKVFEIKSKINADNNLHLKKRIDVSEINIERYISIIEGGLLPYKIIEYNETLRDNVLDHRVVIRDKKKEYRTYHKGKTIETTGWCNLCFVLSIDTGKIITAYYNDANDSHTSLDLRRYDKKLEIIKKEDKVCA